MKITLTLFIFLLCCSIGKLQAQATDDPPENHPRVCIGNHDGGNDTYIAYCNRIDEPIEIMYSKAIPGLTTVSIMAPQSTGQGALSIDNTFDTSTPAGVFPEVIDPIEVDPLEILSLYGGELDCNSEIKQTTITITVCVFNPHSEFGGVDGGIQLGQSNCWTIALDFCCPPEMLIASNNIEDHTHEIDSKRIDIIGEEST